MLPAFAVAPPLLPFAPPIPAPEPFPSPFDALGPHPLARVAAEQLQAELRAGLAQALQGGEGKMFGVLVVQTPDGRFGVLRGFGGMLGARWDVPGFVPPMFDRAAREAIEPAGEAEVKRLVARADDFARSSGLSDLRARVAELLARHADELSRLRERHADNRQRRHAARAQATSDEARHALDQQSRADKAERRRLEAAHVQEAQQAQTALSRQERRAAALERLRHHVCRRLMQRIHDTYRVPDARGGTRALRSLWAPGEPPSGAGDCAAPKLLASAYRLGLRPVALAEFWWGPPPPAGGRVSGVFYPACRDKCGPLLPAMLEGLAVAPPRVFVPPAPADDLCVVFEDARIVVIDKPAGMLSVPGRGEALEDSVLARLRKRHPDASGPLLVHRLDLDTSGLLVAALDADAFVDLQRQFASREVLKRYVAWLDGEVRGDEGVIDLPIRVDLDDRPRQIHDPVHGKPALTEWRVIERRDGRTRVSLFPVTGRTHQLRVHAAHPLGLGASIVGDRLYGREAPRLHLHAEAIAFRHPHTGERVSFERPAPF